MENNRIATAKVIFKKEEGLVRPLFRFRLRRRAADI